jgi:hypothetical protein
MKPAEIHSWRQSPFDVGRRYRVRCDFKALRDSFLAGVSICLDKANNHPGGWRKLEE